MADASERTSIGEVVRGLDQKVDRAINIPAVFIEPCEDRRMGFKGSRRWGSWLSRRHARRRVCIG